MKFKIVNILVNAFFILMMLSCENENIDTKVTQDKFQNGVFILNEGIFNRQNTSLSFYSKDSTKIYNNIYGDLNHEELGDIGQSMTLIGQNLYIVANNSSKIVVIDSKSGKLVAKINGLASPRYILQINQQKAYISDLYSASIQILDLLTNKITGKISCFKSTEQMVKYSDKVYVCDWSNGDSVEIIDTKTDKKIKSIHVVREPNSIVIDKNNKIWVLCSGGYLRNELPALIKINPENDQIEQSLIFTNENSYPTRLSINQTLDTLYFMDNHIFKMAINSNQIPDLPIINSNGRILYGLGIDPSNSDIYISDAIDYSQIGIVYQYNSNGGLKHKFEAGINPNFFCFIK